MHTQHQQREEPFSSAQLPENHRPITTRARNGGLLLPSSRFELPYVAEQELRQRIREVGLAGNELVEKAFTQAKESHSEQTRDDGGPYLELHIYPVTLATINHEEAVGNRVSAKIVATALTHDVPEDDKNVPLEVFYERFGVGDTHTLKPGRSVYDLVVPLTKRKVSEYPGKRWRDKRAARNEDYHRGLNNALYETQIVKLADREQNLLSLHSCTVEKIMGKIKETEEHYLPIAQRISPRFYDSLLERICELKVWLESGGIAA